MEKQIGEAAVMEGFIESPGWQLMKEYLIDRIRTMKNKVFEKSFRQEELTAAQREVYILKKILERPDDIIKLGKEAEKHIGSK